MFTPNQERAAAERLRVVRVTSCTWPAGCAGAGVWAGLSADVAAGGAPLVCTGGAPAAFAAGVAATPVVPLALVAVMQPGNICCDTSIQPFRASAHGPLSFVNHW